MTDVNGLRLAYRGFVTGIAAAYVWVASALVLSALLHADALVALRPFADLVVNGAGESRELAFVLGFALIQLGGGFLGMVTAYFIGRYFTVRPTLAVAVPCCVLLAWALVAVGLESLGARTRGIEAVTVVATLAYGLLLGIGLPVRGDGLRDQSGSPST
jgi:hypothetical protein